MKHYITIGAALLLSAVLIFNPSAKAASMTISYNVVSSTIAPLVNVYYPELDETGNPVGNYVIATYEYSFSPQIVFSSFDGYINGTSTAVFSISPVTPTGGNNSGMTAEYTPISSDTVFSSGYTRFSTNGSIEYWLSSYYHNYQSYSTQLRLNSITGLVSYYFTYTGSNTPDPTQYINVSISLSANYSNMAITPDPASMGMVNIISTGIIDAFNDQSLPFDDILQYIQYINTTLGNVYTHNEQWYSAIVDELLANNQYNVLISNSLSDIYNELIFQGVQNDNIISIISDLRTYMTTFPSYSSQVLVLLGKLADMNAAQQTEAAAIASQYDSLQQQQDNANAVVKAVPRPTFSASQFDSGNMVDTTQRQNFTGLLSLIVGNGYITRIFIIVITFATAGFILFGKKK